MSDDDEEYNSSEESNSEDEIAFKKLNSDANSTANNTTLSKKSTGSGAAHTLTLEDNEDDSSEFQRPDLTDDYDDDVGEDDDDEEIDGEDEDESYEKRNKKSFKKNKLRRSDSEDTVAKNKKKKRKKQIGICVTATKYDCVRRVARKLGFKEVEENEDWTLFWTDTSVSIDRVNMMKRWQKINHYPGMSEICRKDFLTRNMNRMAKLYPKDYTFYPKAWCLPADYADLANYARLKKNKTYICKPDSGCQGRGIFITKNPYKDIKPGDNYVAQVYVSRPFTIDGFKFDLRVYVAVTSCDPFRIFVYKEGIARFTTEQYEEPTQINCKDVFMHLTNYAIQKRSDEFIRDEETGTKRRISTINKWLREHGYDVDKLWNDIDDILIKVLLSAHAVLKHNYRTCFANHYKGSACFEILGYDILIDKKLKPYVLEVNHSPSFTTDSKLDREIKDALIYDCIMLMNIGSSDKRRCIDEERKRVRERLFLKQGRKETKEELDEVLQEWLKQIEKWEDKHMGNFRRIYPAKGSEKYDRFYNNTGTLFSETAASRARIEQAKIQMFEVSKKNEKFIGANKNLNKYQKESRGESPVRKTSTNSTMPNRTLNGTTSNLTTMANNTINSIPPTPGINSKTNKNKLQQLSRNASVVPLSNTTINIDIINNNNQSGTYNNNVIKILDRPNSGVKNNNLQQMNSLLVTKPHLMLPSSAHSTLSDTWKPFEINELDEMERVQSLKHRENLIKGMGITDFVNRILHGTPGTVATIPPSFINNKNVTVSNPTTTNQTNNDDTNQHDAIGKTLTINSNFNNKFEIKTKNYNPFENHSLFAEKYINNQRNNLSTNGFRTNKNSTGNNVNINSNPTTNSNNSTSNQTRNKFVNSQNQESNQANLNNYRYSNHNNDNQSNTTSNNQKYIHLSNSNTDSLNGIKNSKTNRFPIELFAKNDISNQQTKLLNSYRIRSAQNLAKQRTTGLYIFSYHTPTRTVPE